MMKVLQADHPAQPFNMCSQIKWSNVWETPYTHMHSPADIQNHTMALRQAGAKRFLSAVQNWQFLMMA